MAKLPFIQFYPLDWFRDTLKLSHQARAAWIDILALAWNEPERGVYKRTRRAMMLELRIAEEALDGVLEELLGVAEVVVEKGTITIMSRRMRKEETTREYERNKKRWQREKELSPNCPPNVPQEKLEVRSQKLEVIKDKRVSPPTPSLPPNAFETIWASYPRREGRKEAVRHFQASVRTMKNWLDIQNALEHYKAYLRKEHTEYQYTKMGSTWFNNWQDYVNYTGGQHGDDERESFYGRLAAEARATRGVPGLRKVSEDAAGKILGRVRCREVDTKEVAGPGHQEPDGG